MHLKWIMAQKRGQSVLTLRVEDFMVSPAIVVKTNMSLEEVVDLYLKNKISGAPVVDHNERVISVISQSDLIHFIAVDGLKHQVSTYLNRLPKPEQIVSVQKTDLFKEVFKQFLIKPVRRILVVDTVGKIQGVISKSSLLKAFKLESMPPLTPGENS